MDQRPNPWCGRRNEQPSPVNLVAETWTAWEPRFRAQFFNSLGGARQMGLLTTFSPAGVANAAVFNQTLHVSANPPQLGFLFRPLTAEHQGLRYLRAQGCFGFHLMSGGIDSAAAVHQCSAKYPEGESELDAQGLTWSVFDHVRAPRVDAAAVSYGLTLAEEHELANGTVLVVGSVAEVHLSDDVLVGDDGFARLPEDLLLAQGLDSYHHSASVGRFRYAQPEHKPSLL